MAVNNYKPGIHNIIPKFFVEMVSMKEGNRGKNTRDAIVISIILLATTFLGKVFGVTPMFPNYIVAITFGISLEMIRFYKDVSNSLVNTMYVIKDKGPSSLQRIYILSAYNTFCVLNKVMYIALGLCTIQLCLSNSFFSYLVSFLELIAIVKIITYRTMIDKDIRYGWDVFKIVIVLAPISIILRSFVVLSMGAIYFVPLIMVSWALAHLLVNKNFSKIVSTSSKNDKFVSVLEGDYNGSKLVDEEYRAQDVIREKEDIKRRVAYEAAEKKRREEEGLAKKGTFENLSENERKRAKRKFFDDSILKTPPKPRNRRIGFGWYDEETYQNYLRDHELGPYSPNYKEKDPTPKSKEQTGGYVDVEDDSSSVNRFRNKR